MRSSLFFLSAYYLLSVALASADGQQEHQQLLLDAFLHGEDHAPVPIHAVASSDSAAAAAKKDLTFSPFLEHYGSPAGGCEDDEKPFRIQGIPGGVCSRKCTDFLPCPTDLPDGATANPMCALQDQSGNKYCVLVCQATTGDNLLRGTDTQCGAATCRPIPQQPDGLGICTYDSSLN